ncbi:MAG: class D beta-lactamase, partial [Magnetococcales bacterium]|nr:class D beta-lactamase [Magnetococcales bacterium]
VSDPALADVLRQAGVVGCIALVDLSSRGVRYSGSPACTERFQPASTFKILNALIALEIGVVQENELFPWDRIPQPYQAWERDLTLREAMAVSDVPVFQAIARRIGRARMAEWVKRAEYGNAEIGDQVDRFWLDGPLAITPLEQVRWLVRLASGELPFSDRAQAGLHRLMPQEREMGALVLGKTGWTGSKSTPRVGWYVGWVEQEKPLLAFAVQIFVSSEAQLPLRRSLALAALRRIGVIQSDQSESSR